MGRMASGVGLIPEQNWENADLAASPFGTDPTIASIGFVNGGPAGSAAPLDWSAGAFVRLARDLASGKLLDRPASTYSRYVQHTQGTTPLTVTSPPDQSAIGGSPVTVSGTSAAGNTVYVAATNTDNTFTTSTASTTVAAGGTWSVQVPVDGGTRFFLPRLPAIASIGTIMKNRPISMAAPIVTLYHFVFALRPANADPLFAVPDVKA